MVETACALVSRNALHIVCVNYGAMFSCFQVIDRIIVLRAFGTATILETNEDLSVHSFCTMIESSSYSYRSVSYSSISESDVSVLCYDDEEFSHVQVSDTCQQNLILDESLPSVPATIQPFADSQCDLNCSLPSTAVTSAPMCDPTLLSYRRNNAEMERSHCCTFM